MINKMTSELKMRIALNTFKFKVNIIENKCRKIEIDEQNKDFIRRLDGMTKGKRKTKKRRNQNRP